MGKGGGKDRKEDEEKVRVERARNEKSGENEGKDKGEKRMGKSTENIREREGREMETEE